MRRRLFTLGCAMRFPVFVSTLLVCAGLTTQVQSHARPLGFLSSGPHCKMMASPPVGSLWLGHFSGGAVRRVALNGSDIIIWQDQHVCFTSRQDCALWQRQMRKVYRHVEGWRSCLPIR